MAQNNENGSNSNIPDDLALSILSKLPLKSLKRFTCVQKSWSLLFENPNFMSMFQRNFISNCHYSSDSYLLLKKHGELVEGYPRELIWISGERFGKKVNLGQLSSLDPPLSYRYFDFLGLDSGIHGIICIWAPLGEKDSTVLLWNPATGESLIVPPSPFNFNLPPFDSRHPPSDYEIVQCGFGYDHVGDDFKLIQCIYFWTKGLPNIWEIYSVRSNTWRKLDVNMACTMPFYEFRPRDLYLNGVCHWKAYCEKHLNTEAIPMTPYPHWKAYCEKHLVSFNLNSEVVLMTPYPVDKRDDQMDVILDVLNGSIALISNENNSICISILGEIGVEKSWTKLFTFGPLPCNVRTLYGVGNKGNILYIKKEDHELASFDLSTQMVEEIDVKGSMYCSRIIIYKESLLPIRGINN